MQLQRILAYLLYAIILFGSLFAGSWLTTIIKIWIGRTYRPIPGFIGYTVICILIGLILGTEHLILEFRKPGNWSANKTRLILLVIPSAFCAFYMLIVFATGIPIVIPAFIANTNLFTYISGVFFGYTLLTSFYKKPESNVENTQTPELKI